jgi:DNA-binding transcriptional LysR family regulator
VRKRSDRIDWDGLRYFRAVAAAGTLSGAARALGVEHTTVARRIDGLEAELRARLFLRNPRGYVLTAVGEAILESADAMDEQLDRAMRLAGGQDIEMRGAVRLATADALATHLVLPALSNVRRAHPELTVELISDIRQHDLSRREADLALRLGASTDDRLIVKKVGPLGFGVYGARALARKRIDETKASWVGFDDVEGPQPHEEWLAKRVPGAKVVLRSNRQHTLLEAVRMGVGLGILPCFIADADEALVRLLGPEDVFARDLALHIHSDLHRTRRVRVLMDAISGHVAARANRMAGALPLNGSSAPRRRTAAQHPREPK